MFDVTNKLSFESLDYWLQEFTSNGGKHPVIAVVANKVRHLFNLMAKEARRTLVLVLVTSSIFASCSNLIHSFITLRMR